MPRAAPAAKQALVTAAGRGKDTKPVAAQPRAFAMPETRIEKCPLCVEEMDDTDLQFEPCPCGYKVCLFCFDKLKLLCSSMCPHCRRIYGTVDDITEASKEDTSDDAAACAVDASQARVAPARQAAVAASGLPNGGAAGASTAPKPAAQQPAKMAATGAVQGRKAEAGAAAKPVPGAGAEASHHHGLPGTATWATAASAMRTESVEMERPSLATAIGDETAWPSLADATTNARTKPEPDTRRRDQAGVAGPWQLANHHHDRAASSSSSMDQLTQDPPLTQDQVLQFQQQQQAQAAVAQQQQQQRQQQQAQQQQQQLQAQAQQQAQAAQQQQQQQQQQQPSTSYQPLGPQFPPPGFAGLRRDGAAPLAAVNGGVDPFLPSTSLHSAPPQQLVQMLLQKERENGKVQPLVAAAKPPPGFAPSTAGVVAPVAAPPPSFRPPDLSMLNNDENPVVPGPPVTRCRPISPPAANGNNGPIGKVANTGGSLHTPGVYSMWSGLPVVDLSVYNPLSHLWQNANTAVAGLVQHQHHQQQQQQQHPQQHMPLHLQQQQQQQHPQQQQQQYSSLGASSLDPAIVFPPAPQPTKLPPPGFGGPSAYGHVAAGQGENGIPRNGTYRPPYQPIGTRTAYNPLEFVQQQAAMYRPHLGTGL